MRFLTLINNLLTRIILSTQYCVLCGSKTNSQQICNYCYQDLMRQATMTPQRCWKCLIKMQPHQIVCSNCSENKFIFDRIVAAFDYGFPLDQILQQLKYRTKLEYSALLSQLFYAKISTQITHLPDIIIPVPLHPKKHKLRGFNQTHEILREFANLHPKVRILYATRSKETQPQATLNRGERIANLHNAFRIHENLSGKSVAIIDDVVTTGTTVNELARECRKLGADKVEIWCLMRAQHD